MESSYCIISEGGVGKVSPWRSVTHFNYKLLRNSFCTALLNELEDHIGSSFKSTKSYIYKNCKNGFYVFAKPRKCNPKAVVKYIGRYHWASCNCYLPASTSMMVSSSPSITIVTRITFLLLKSYSYWILWNSLIQHIPEKHFKMIRYYGLYARHP